MKSKTFLLIEDDELEKIKFKRILNQISDNRHNLIISNDGTDALLKIDNGEIPDVIILDLNMPKMNGLEFLSFLKDTNYLLHIPVVVFSSSYNENEIKKCYENGAAGYIVKPVDFDEYQIKMHSLIKFWEQNEVVK